MFKFSIFHTKSLCLLQSTTLYQTAVRCIGTGTGKFLMKPSSPLLKPIASQEQITWISSLTHRRHPPSTFLSHSRYLKINSGSRQLIRPHYKSDRVPEHFSIVYESGLKTYVYLLHGIIVALGVSTAGLLVMDGHQILDNLFQEGLDGIIFSLTSVAVAVAMAALVYFSRTIPIRIYYDGGSGGFVAIRRTLIGRLRQLNYFPSDINLKPRLTGEDISESAEVVIKGQKQYLRAEDFVAPEYYSVHIGDGRGDLKKPFVGGPKF